MTIGKLIHASPLSRPRVSVRRPVSGRLHIRMPYRSDNHELLSSGGRGVRPKWERPLWTASRASLRAVVDALLTVYDCVEVITDGGLANKCDTRCREAVGDDCICSCAGQQHGIGLLGAGELVVGETTIVDTTIVRWRRVVCRPSPRR